MQSQALPPDFEETRDTTAQDLESVPGINLEAVHVLERCMAEHHVAEVDYTEPDERQETIRIRPAFIRTSKAHNLVAWGYPIGADHWIELRIACEAWAHQGEAKSAQKDKVTKDILKLMFLRSL